MSAEIPEADNPLLAVLRAAHGHMLNARIDLETGAAKRTAIMTLDGGIAILRHAIETEEARARRYREGMPERN